MDDIVERLSNYELWTVDEAAISGRLVPQRKIDQWIQERKEAAAEILRLREELAKERVWEADPTAQSDPLTEGQRILAWWETSTVAEPCELAQKIDQALTRLREERDGAVTAEREACAKVADEHSAWTRSMGAEEACEMVAAAILQLYTGQRTKSCRKLRDAVCQDVTYVGLTEKGVRLGDVRRFPRDIDEFARLDGFKDYAEMWKWFSERYKTNSFTGYVIRWD